MIVYVVMIESSESSHIDEVFASEATAQMRVKELGSVLDEDMSAYVEVREVNE